MRLKIIWFFHKIEIKIINPSKVGYRTCLASDRLLFGPLISPYLEKYYFKTTTKNNQESLVSNTNSTCSEIHQL